MFPTPGRPGGAHAKASTRFLTDVSPPTSETFLDAGISMDQIAAREMGKHTQLASLELAIESGETAGACDVGFACAYTNTISWRSANTPLPTENNPRAVFERLFGDSGSTDPKVRLARIRQDRSVLDSVIEEAAHLQGSLGPGDRTKLVEYLDAIRDVERRIQKAEEQSALELPRIDHPAGIPATYDEHVKLMCDLQVLAYQADLTRVVTFMLGREFSGVTYPQIGVPDAHHPITHHQQEPEKIAKVAKINAYHVTQFAYLLDKLRSTPDGDGSLLDHVIDDLRDRHGRLQRPRPAQHSPPAGGRRRGSAQGRTSHPISEGDAAGEPAPDAAGQAGRALGSDRRQHRQARRSGALGDLNS